MAMQTATATNPSYYEVSGAADNTTPNRPTQADKTEVIGLWVRAPKAVIYHTALTDGAKLLYIILRDYQGRNAYAFPSVDTLARDTGKSVRRVQQLIKELEEAGAIEVVTQRGWVSLYHTCYPEAKREDVEAAEQAAAEKEQTIENGYRNSCQPTRPRKIVVPVPPQSVSPVPPKPVAPELDEFKLDSNTNVCKETGNLAQNEQLRSGNQNSQYQQPPTFKLIDSQKSSYQKVSPLVKEVLTDTQQEIANKLFKAGVALETANDIARTDPRLEHVNQWIEFSKNKTNPGGYLAVVLTKGEVIAPPKPQPHHSINQTRNDKKQFSRNQEAGAVAYIRRHATHNSNDNTNSPEQAEYQANDTGSVDGDTGNATAVTISQPEITSNEVAEFTDVDVAQAELEDKPASDIRPQVSFDPEQAQLLKVIRRFAPKAAERAVDIRVEPFVFGQQKLIITLVGDVNDNVENYWLSQLSRYDATKNISRVEFRAVSVSPIEKQGANSNESATLPVVENELTQSAISDYQSEYEQSETVAVAATPITAPSSPASLNANSDSRLAKALQLLEADATFVADASLENNQRGEPTLTVTFRADQKPTVKSLEAWKQAVLRFNPFTRTIKHIVVKELQSEPGRSEAVELGGYSCNFQPIAAKEPCEQAALLANTKSDCEAWKTPAISKCLELLGDDAELVRDIRIGLNWIGQLAIIAVFDADRQLSSEKLVVWRNQILKGHNKELRGKNIKEVEVELLKPSANPARADSAKLDGGDEKIAEPNHSGEVELADNYQPEANATVTNLPEFEAQLPEVAAKVVEAEPGTSEAATPLGEVEKVTQCETATSQAEKTELPVCTPVSANCNSDRKPSAQLLAMLEQQAERRRELASRFNFNRPHITIHNDFQMLRQANQWWRQTYRRCYGVDAPKDEIEQRIAEWQLRFPAN